MNVPEDLLRKAKVIPLETELNEFVVSDLAGVPVPEIQFHDANGLIPQCGVTLLFGDGGTGKSSIAQQLAVGTCLGKEWLGIHVKSGPVFYFSAEDPKEIIHKRLYDYCKFIGAEMAELSNLNIASMLGHDCVMAVKQKDGVIKPTKVFHKFVERLKAIKPALVIVDNAIDVFAGDQNDAAQVKQFMHLLSGVSIDCDCPIVLLAHPSRSGMSSGSGDAGSVHWSNSARSRLYLTRVFSEHDNQQIEDDKNARILKVMKSNYSSTGDEIEMRYEDGCFVHQQAKRIDPSCNIGAIDRARRVFKHLLSWHLTKNIHVSASRSSTFAPALFASHTQSEGVTKRMFEKAMMELLDEDIIAIEEHGPPSKRRKHLVIKKVSE